MNAADVMTSAVISVAPDTPVGDIVALLLRHGISGVPVVDKDGSVLGVVSEGDLLRRAELGTEKQRGTWRTFFTGTARLAGEYVRSHGRQARSARRSSANASSRPMPISAPTRCCRRWPAARASSSRAASPTRPSSSRR